MVRGGMEEKRRRAAAVQKNKAPQSKNEEGAAVLRPYKREESAGRRRYKEKRDAGLPGKNRDARPAKPGCRSTGRNACATKAASSRRTPIFEPACRGQSATGL